MSEAKPIHGAASRAFARQLHDENRQLRSDNKALRDERDRLRRALEDIRDSIGNGALNVNWIKQYAEAALTPAGGASQRWSRKKPTEPGFYWYRSPHGFAPMVAQVSRNAAWFTSGKCTGLDDLHGEWQGPLTPNEAME